MTTPNKTSAISVQSTNEQFETISITLKKGMVKPQQLHVLLEFLLVCRPYHALKIIHNMGLVFSQSEELQEMDLKQNHALKEVLHLFTNLWAAEHNQFEPMDLDLFH
ncbi:hypothetical protein OQZ33_04380 [Pedobacter sp. MC2016-05]|uniref:hypothetical protein n=1 Tax=Pedobacter sp. MC2016-05 TaxID=2994474 RepID=UPI00224505BF|nr:hypothetical protein [Pedobacter sp. MC2016-05]MCX2473563.1 hypothetical protein [Pedobacter sp. MC2016-05]